MRAASSIHIGHEAQISAAFGCARNSALVMGAESGFLARIDLGLRRHELAYEFGVFIINHAAIGRAKKALFFFLLMFLLVHRGVLVI